MSWSGNLLQIAGVSLGFGTVVRRLRFAFCFLRFAFCYGLGSCHHQRFTQVLRLQGRVGSPAIKFLSSAILVLKHLKS